MSTVSARLGSWLFVALGAFAVCGGTEAARRPNIVVMLTDGILKVDNGKEQTEVSLVAGQAYMRPAGIEHDVMNGSPHAIAFVEIEVKRPDALVQLP